MKIRVKYFGMVAELTGKSEEEIDVQAIPLSELKKLLERRYSGFDKLSIKPAINLDLVPWETELQEGDEVSFLPPFAGG